MSPSRSSPFAALATLLWPLYLACTALIALVWLTGFGPGVLADPDFARRVPNADLRAALGAIARGLDAAWLTLGAICVYLATVRAEGIAAARRWCGLVLVAALAITAASALTGLPLGPVHYPPNLGRKLGPVPFALPFLWLIVVLGARDAVLRRYPRLSHGGVAALTGICCALTSLTLDPLAWKVRAWWLWYPNQHDAPPNAPWTSHLTWLLACGALAFAMRPDSVAPRVKSRPVAPLVAWLSLLGLAFLTHLVR